LGPVIAVIPSGHRSPKQEIAGSGGASNALTSVASAIGGYVDFGNFEGGDAYFETEVDCEEIAIGSNLA
jgi:hypothetical protein